ncbi:MAG: hypothetical protein PUE12_11585 [Oscillospiraceae bacterium]|nr:hypothetical protein [Oscillospiraceae bacterium]
MIKIKLGIVDSDRLYLKRLTDFLGRKYSTQIEIYSFSESEGVLEAVKENRINVLAVSSDTEIDPDKIADFCMFAYITDSGIIDTYNGRRTIFRYQRADVIYKQILGLYSEKLADKVRYRTTGAKKANISLFLSVCDGAGATTAAAAFAEHQTRIGKKTLFLNLKQFRDTGSIFNAAGEGTFTDVIFALKSRKVNMTLKMESVVKQNSSGVYFYDTCTSPLDYTEIREDELKVLIDEMSTSFGYDDVVIVSDFFITDRLIILLEYAKEIIMVSGDGKQFKTYLTYRTGAIEKIEKRRHINITDKLRVIFNRTKFSKTFHTDIPVIGIQADISTDDEREIVKKFSASDMFDKICVTEAAI